MFQFYAPGEIIFGEGKIAELARVLPKYGQRCLIVTPKGFPEKLGIQGLLHSLAAAQGVQLFYLYAEEGEPEPAGIDAGVMQAREWGCEVCVGIGGGSVIDTAKAIAALAPAGEPVTSFLEGVGQGKEILWDTLPFVAVPTTAGTGAEATKNAVISSRRHRFKKSFRSEKMLARTAVIDPKLTLSVPPGVTARTGMDAITQLIEAYTSKKANEMTDALCLYALRRAGAIIPAYEDGQNLSARQDMCICSLYSGLALANAGLGAAHGFAAGLGAFYGIPHGEACAVLLPHVMRLNRETALGKYADIGRILCGGCEGKSDDYASMAGIELVEEWNYCMGLPSSLKYISVRKEEILPLVHASMGGSMSGNPLGMTVVEMAEFIEYLL